MTKKNKEDIEEERGYVIFPDSERCKVSGCAFYEESDVDSVTGKVYRQQVFDELEGDE